MIVTLAAFGGLFSSGFINYDDTEYVTENIHVQKGLTGESIAWAFTNTDSANWHPLTWLSHMLDVQLFGLNSGGHHGTSLLLHTLNGLLLFLLLFRMTGALWRSAFVAALFAIHPLHVESVAWIAERKDVLSTLFWLLTLGAWLRYVKSKKAAPYVLALALFALGLMAKPMLVTLPFTLLLLDYWPLRRLVPPLRRRSGVLKGLLWEKAPFFLMSAASCVITIVAQRSGGAVVKLGEYGFFGRLANAALAYVGYLRKTFWPSSLAVFYPHPRTGLATWSVCASFLLLAGATVLAVRLAKRAPYLTFGWFWYLGTLVPVIGFVQVGSQAMADRYTYMPLIGVFIAIAWGLAGLAEKIPRMRLAAPCMAAASLAVLLPVARVQTGHWNNSVVLFQHALAVTPDNYLAHDSLGLALAFGKEDRIPEAIEHFRQALRIKPDYVQALNNLGLAFEMADRLPEAIESFERVVRMDSDFADAQNNLGFALARADRTAEAVEHYQRALKIKPDFVKAMNNMGLALGKMNRLPEAIESFRDAVRINPDFAEAQDDLGTALAYTGRHAEAIEHYRQALRIRPGDSQVLNKLGVVLMRVNRESEALECFQKAMEIKPDFVDARNNLGYALYLQNRIPEAIERFTETLRIKPDDAPALDNLGMALTKAGRLSEALERFEQALRIEPDDEEARAGLLEIQKAQGPRR